MSEIADSDISQKDEDEIMEEKQRKKIMLLKTRESKTNPPENATNGPIIFMTKDLRAVEVQQYEAVCFIDTFPVSLQKCK